MKFLIIAQVGHYRLIISTQSLTLKVVHFVDRAPMVLEEKNDRNQCRVSFIGHSLGSVMIRLALQNPNLSFLRNKLHLFVSLASPHIGNLFSDSQLVSTGKVFDALSVIQEAFMKIIIS